MSVLGTHLYQCTSWHCCERRYVASVNFFWRLNEFAHFTVGDLQTHLPTLRWVFSSFRWDNICYNMGGPWKPYATLSQTQGTSNMRFHLNEVPKVGKFTAIKSRIVVTRGWERGKWWVSYCLVSTEVSWDDKTVLEIDSSDNWTLWMYLMPLNCILKMVKAVNFMLCVSYHHRKDTKHM